MNNRMNALALRRLGGLTAIAIVGASVVGNGEAAEKESERKRSVLEEIVVTAQKREEQLQDVPISISVLSGADLDRFTVADITEALSRVPGVSVSQTPGGPSKVHVRGVSSNTVFNGGANTIAYYLGSVPFGFVRSAIGPDPSVYDLDRVEVLRGPQGTLFGANALNGVVRVLTKDANPDAFEFKARMSASGTQGGGENYRGDTAVNVPIVPGKLAARAVLGYQDWSGWIDRPHREDANNAERRNMRLNINAQPTEQLSIGVSAWGSRDDYGAGPQGSVDDRFSVAEDEPISTDFDAYGLKFGYDFPWFTVASTTSYVDYANDGSQLIFTNETFMQEVVLTSTPGGSWRWTLGGMYRDSKDQQAQLSSSPALAPAIWSDTSKSHAVFGELTRLFLDGRLELTAGLRYFEDDVGVTEHSRFAVGVLPPESLVNSDVTSSATTPRLVLTWYPSEQMTVYASYSEGFRSGAHQIPSLLSAVPFPSIEPDELTNYEVGAKASLLGGRLSFETALYYIDWQDIQRQLNVFFPELNRGFNALVNSGSASGMGVDFGVTTQPVDGLNLGVNFGWNDLTQDVDMFSGGVLMFEKGERLNFSPEYTVGASAEYGFPLGTNGFEGQFSASANYTSVQAFKILRGADILRSDGDPMLIARTSVSIRAPDNWTATLFVDNVNNERGSPLKDFRVPQEHFIRVRPRTIGVQLEYHF